MGEIVTIIAESRGEHKEIFKVKQGKDESLYVFFSGLKPPDAHLSLHASGDFHVRRSRNGKKLSVRLPEGQPLKTYKGCDSPNECVINRLIFDQYKKRDIGHIKNEVFTVNLATFRTPWVGVILYLFDQESIGQFQRQASKYVPQQSKIISNLLPNIGLVAHEFITNKYAYPFFAQHP
jgi:hypothetical protein